MFSSLLCPVTPLYISHRLLLKPSCILQTVNGEHCYLLINFLGTEMVCVYFAVLLKMSYPKRKQGCHWEQFSKIGENLHVEELTDLFHKPP